MTIWVWESLVLPWHVLVHSRLVFHITGQMLMDFFALLFQHFREHLDKLFAKGIGMLDIALNEAFSILSDVSSSLICLSLLQENRWNFFFKLWTSIIVSPGRHWAVSTGIEWGRVRLAIWVIWGTRPTWWSHTSPLLGRVDGAVWSGDSPDTLIDSGAVSVSTLEHHLMQISFHLKNSQFLHGVDSLLTVSHWVPACGAVQREKGFSEWCV